MPKTATIAVRIDEDLKSSAQDALDAMGLPMSLAVEMFLRQVAEKGKLPFSIGPEGPTPEELAERERRERDFWKAFMTWYFRAWPMFDSPEAARRAQSDLGYTGRSAGAVARDYIRGGDGSFADMTQAQVDAYFDLSDACSLLSDAKELVYWALGMDKTFVPSLACAYAPQLDAWRLEYLEEKLRDPYEDDEDDDPRDGPGEGE